MSLQKRNWFADPNEIRTALLTRRGRRDAMSGLSVAAMCATVAIMSIIVPPGIPTIFWTVSMFLLGHWKGKQLLAWIRPNKELAAIMTAINVVLPMLATLFWIRATDDDFGVSSAVGALFFTLISLLVMWYFNISVALASEEPDKPPNHK